MLEASHQRKGSQHSALVVLQATTIDDEELSSEEEILDSEEGEDDEWNPSLATPAAQGRRIRRSSHSRQSNRPSVRTTQPGSVMVWTWQRSRTPTPALLLAVSVHTVQYYKMSHGTPVGVSQDSKPQSH